MRCLEVGLVVWTEGFWSGVDGLIPWENEESI